MRLDKFLADCGVASRKELKTIIKAGRVSVDGTVVKNAGLSVNPQKDTVSVDNQTVVYEKYVYLMMNKPPGVLSATTDQRQKTVVDLLPDSYRHFALFPVGRLDIDTEGLLLLTNDGKLAHKLLSPKKKVPKQYYAKVEGVVDTCDQEAFANGISLKDFTTLPAQLTILQSGPISEVEVTIMEGKFHQVKRMFASQNKAVVYLKRTAFAGLHLDPTLSPGKFRRLTEDELKAIGLR